MSYREDLADLVTTNADAIRADLARAREKLGHLNGEVLRVSNEIAAMDWLLALADGEPLQNSATPTTLHEAMAEVLKSAPGRMLRAKDLAGEIHRRGLYRMRDGRAVEPQQIHARVGNYPQMFGKEGTFIKLL